MSNSNRILQRPITYNIYMTFLKTLLALLRESRIFAAVALGIENLYAFKRIVIQNSNFIMKSFIHPMNTRVLEGKKELLKIFIKACKRVSLLVHG